MDAPVTAIVGWLAPILSTLIICAGQLALNARFKRADEKRDAARAETDAKRKAEAEWRETVDKLLAEQGEALKSVADDRVDWYAWREAIVSHMNDQDDKVMSMLKAQVTQMRSDALHRAHRYIDDLGCASTEEKNAFWAEYEEYCELCEQYGIENDVVDELAKRVMYLPEREI